MAAKYVILVGDGMADRPADFPGRATPLVRAATPNLDRMASLGETGWAWTVPEGMDPGSDVANMALLGYDPRRWYTGRAPLEAASMGIDLGPRDVAYRCNLVHLDPAADAGLLDDGTVMGSYSAGHITTAEAAELVGELDRVLGRPGRRFHAGVSYRHLLVMAGGPADLKLVPPHDISGQSIGGRLPSGEGAVLRELMASAAPVLAAHPVNAARAAAGKPTANSIWLWGQGRKPAMPAFVSEHGLSGAVVTAVDLVKGIGRVTGLEVLDVPGATGWIDTDYDGKVAATLAALERLDFVFLHVEAPDEAGHEGSDDLKVRAIADFDRRVVGPVLEGLRRFPAWAVMATADHLTPVAIRTHSAEPVPYAILRSGDTGGAALTFDENALDGKPVLPDGASLMRRFLRG